MSLPEPILDDLRFQKDLVDEARRRVAHYCPEWTEYNVSDPGITLIELFAWMTEMMVYRVNKVPEKVHVKFMELLGTQLAPPVSANTVLTFWLSTPFPISPDSDIIAGVRKGTEVATRRTVDDQEEIIFTTNESLTIVPPLFKYLFQHDDFRTNYQDKLGRQKGFTPFQEVPEQGDSFYIGFDPTHDLRGHILQLRFTCEAKRGTGITTDYPPLVWECLIGDDEWQRLYPSERAGEEDTTGGFNFANGQVVFYLPLEAKASAVAGRDAFWLRCRFEIHDDEQGVYQNSPVIRNLDAYSLGASVKASHAVIIENELLGESSGDPNQAFTLQNTPVLGLNAQEVALVREKIDGEWVDVPWQAVTDFSDSDAFDRHFTLDQLSGEIQFGPSIRHRNGEVKQYGRVPPAGSEIRFRRYRFGGGVVGNVPTGKLVVLKSAIPYIDRATNLSEASGGLDTESLDEVKLRSRQELRAQLRAVTAEDYEVLAKKETREVARVKCNVPFHNRGYLAPGNVELLIVPAVKDSLRDNESNLSKLQVDTDLLEKIRRHLDKFRVLTTTLQVKAPKYVGVQVQATIVAGDHSRPDVVQARVHAQLTAFLNPLDVTVDNASRDELMGDQWEGWPFGRNLYNAEIFSLIQRVPGVKHVLEVELHQREVEPQEEPPFRRR